MADAFELAWRFGWALVGGILGALAVAVVVVTAAAAVFILGERLATNTRNAYINLSTWRVTRRRHSRMS